MFFSPFSLEVVFDSFLLIVCKWVVTRFTGHFCGIPHFGGLNPHFSWGPLVGPLQ